MSHRYRLLILPLLFVLGALPARAQTFYTASLTAAQESHSVSETASGTAALVLTDEGVRFYISVQGLSGQMAAAHFHMGMPGMDGGVVRTLTDDFTGGTASGIWTASDAQPLTDDLVAALNAGHLYINIHTPTNGPGEIRGQVFPATGFGLSAALTASQQTHDVSSAGMGTAHVELTDAGAIYFLSANGLSGAITAAHFHGGPMGANGGVARTITDSFNGGTAFGIWTASDAEPLTREMREKLATGGIYLNVHTMANAPGEIRGQVQTGSGWALSARLDPSQQTHAVTSDARGTGTVTLTNAGAVFNVSVDGLSGPIQAAHFHNGAAGSNGGVVRTITGDFDGGTATGLWASTDAEPLTPALMGAMMRGELYFNVHTMANAPGEIRGQVMMTPGDGFSANLTSEQESHSVTQDAHGTATFWLEPTGIGYSVSVEGLSGSIVAAHFHNGAAGMDGGVVRTITDEFTGTTAAGTWTSSDAQPLTDDLIEALFRGDLYLNVHTAANGPGEIRGQIGFSGGTKLVADLTNKQETHDVSQSAWGTASMTLTQHGLAFKVTASDLSGGVVAAHFHRGEAGMDGGVVRTITPDMMGTTAMGLWTPNDAEPLTPELRAALLNGEIYLNFHTMANGPGEIRGQIRVLGSDAGAVVLDPDQQTHAVTSDGRGTAFTLLTPAGIPFAMTASGLSGAITASHFHNGSAGSNGGVVRTITGELTGNTARGVWMGSDAEPLTPALIKEYLDGNLYVNVHTMANAAGEIRGQVLAGQVVTTSIERVGDLELPDGFVLNQNYPNPFNPETTIRFDLPASGRATLELYDMLGRRVAVVADRTFQAGSYEVRLDASDLPSGTYLYRVSQGGNSLSRVMQLIR
jgi:Cu/Zn superoxide dismutase